MKEKRASGENLIKTSTPEEIELALKKAEVEKLSNMLAEKELDLEELKLNVEKFQRRYYSELGKKYVELDELRAQIAEMKARRKPQDHKLNKEAEEARAQAKKAAEEYKGIDLTSEEDFKVHTGSDEAKRLYRKIASIIHPDKATDEKSRQLRTKFMAELNEAYAHKDVARMREILDKWNECPEAITGEDSAAELMYTH